MASDINTVRITDLLQASMRKAMNTELTADDSLPEFVEEHMKEFSKKTGVKVEVEDQPTPEVEAAQRLDGSYDPSLFKFKVQLPVVQEFIELTFIIDPEKK